MTGLSNQQPNLTDDKICYNFLSMVGKLHVSQKYELQWAVSDGSKLLFGILMRMKTQWWLCVQGMVIKTFGASAPLVHP